MRINIDKSNVYTIGDLLNSLDEYGLKDKIIIRPTPMEATPTMPELYKLCFTTEEFAKQEINIARLVLSRGFKIKLLSGNSYAFCRATKANSLIVDPDGSLHKCLAEVGDSKDRVGFIDEDGNIKLNYLEKKWLSFDPFKNSTCRNCNILPLCMGGCLYNDVMKSIKGDKFLRKSQKCISKKINLKEMLSLYFSEYLKKKTATKGTLSTSDITS